MTQEVWFGGARGKEEREKVKQDLALAHNAFRRLESILRAKIKEPTHDYSIANWAFEQADIVGYNRALFEVLRLIRTTDKE